MALTCDVGQVEDGRITALIDWVVGPEAAKAKRHEYKGSACQTCAGGNIHGCAGSGQRAQEVGRTVAWKSVDEVHPAGIEAQRGKECGECHDTLARV